MANINGNVTSTLPTRDLHCKVCDLRLDSVESLSVHIQYHKENLAKWPATSAQHDRDNNNGGGKVKTEAAVCAPADSSDAMITKPSPEFQRRATPEAAQFTHPATPQSYHSAPSPYQAADQNNYSPGTQGFSAHNAQYVHASFPQTHHADQVNWEQQTQYNTGAEYHKPNRFHPYGGGVQERSSHQVSSSSPMYAHSLSRPTPSPSPNQCDKCGFVCDSAMQLTEHCNTAHVNINSNQVFQPFHNKYNTGFNENKVKVEQEETADILDLDSQKVVYQGNENEQPQPAGYDQTQTRDMNSRSSAMMPWDTQKMFNGSQMNGDMALFKEDKMFSEQKVFQQEQKVFPFAQDKYLPLHHDQKQFMHTEQKVYAGMQMPGMNDYTPGMSTPNAEMKPPYRPYDSPNTPQISSTQPTNPTSATLPPIGGKGANWKSNEARRPKTYNCTACNKWFTSSGHLKRHYNTTLHKNAVRSSGQPDPATMPISNHHHPSRDAVRAQQSTPVDTHSPAPSDEARATDDALQFAHRAPVMQPKAPYLQGNLDNSFMSNNPLANHPLPHQVGSHPLNIGSPPGISDISHNAKSTTPSANPPNGQAGPSALQNHSRGLLSITPSNTTTPVSMVNTPALTPHTLPPFSHLAVNPYNPRSTDHLAPSVADPTHHTQLYLGQNFQQTIATNYPNGMSPHVTDMAISNPTFGEFNPEVAQLENDMSLSPSGGRLPSFAALQTQCYKIFVSPSPTVPNVGGTDVDDGLLRNFLVVEPQQQPDEVPDFSTVRDDFQFVTKTCQELFLNSSYGSDDDKDEQLLVIDDAESQNIDYANKENYDQKYNNNNNNIEDDVPSPAGHSDETKSNSSSTVSSTTVPLAETGQIKKIHKCYECDKKFNQGCYLTQHNKTFHNGAKPFKCERCGKRYPDSVTFASHISKHGDEKPFKCPECVKSFNHKTDLRRHMCLHSGKKPFACATCGKAFIRKDHMLKHSEIHLKATLKNSAAKVPKRYQKKSTSLSSV